MKDLYRRLGLDESAPEAVVRAALAACNDADTRAAAGHILLDPDRRAVYDRNRRVLAAIGNLRAHLGLNLTRFWPRSRFGDFTVDLAPPAAARPADDPMRIAWAFGVLGRNGRTVRRRRWVAAMICIVAILVLLAAGWLLRQR
jgi:hypothetical protein